MRSVENELEKCFNKFQEKLLMAGYDVEFENKDEIIEKVSEPILDVVKSSFFFRLIAEIVIKPENSAPIVGKFVFGNSMDFIEEMYFKTSGYTNLYANENYIELSFVLYDQEVYKDIYSPESEEEKLPSMSIDEIIDEHIEEIKNILKAYDIKSEYDDILHSVTVREPLKVAIKMFLV